MYNVKSDNGQQSWKTYIVDLFLGFSGYLYFICIWLFLDYGHAPFNDISVNSRRTYDSSSIVL